MAFPLVRITKNAERVLSIPLVLFMVCGNAHLLDFISRGEVPLFPLHTRHSHLAEYRMQTASCFAADIAFGGEGGFKTRNSRKLGPTKSLVL